MFDEGEAELWWAGKQMEQVPCYLLKMIPKILNQQIKHFAG